MSRQLFQDCVQRALDDYFRDLGPVEPSGLHDLILGAAERPLLQSVMARAGGNQSRAAGWLGINRNTLRRKLVEHGLEAG